MKAGFNHSGSQRYKCGECKRAYTPQAKERGYTQETRKLALRMYVEGNSQRAIARILSISPQSVSNWINAYEAQIPSAPMPSKPKVAELDELYTFVKQKKNKIYVLTVVDRATHCLLSWDAVSKRSTENLQACLERAPQARQYYSDAFPAYDNLYYGAPYEMRSDKKETYSVEAVNADLRHYLKRLSRRSRCFFSSLGFFAQELAHFRILLQPTSVDETKISTIQSATHRLPLSSMMDTPSFSIATRQIGLRDRIYEFLQSLEI